MRCTVLHPFRHRRIRSYIGAVDAPILPIGQFPERKCFKCGGTNVDVTPHYL